MYNIVHLNNIFMYNIVYIKSIFFYKNSKSKFHDKSDFDKLVSEDSS